MICASCGKEGTHYVGPSFGENGFFVCQSEEWKTREPAHEQKYPSLVLQPLTMVPCEHYWLEVRTQRSLVTAICKFRGCQKKYVFSMEEWGALAREGRCLNKPIRV